MDFKDLTKNFSNSKFIIGNIVLLSKNNKIGIIIDNKTDEKNKYLIKLLDNNKKIYEYENYIKLIANNMKTYKNKNNKKINT